ncbi:YbaK/EbsC family protein [Aestuariicella hydrocarbonica]|uniref:YbaK/EbsC family protein n=1 Tax=Pseudomaricurvus hydrocarbonicus TaxID=1470433 RepID=A0A9E5JQW1_9GAMM|nr:YbaK/EbsC family protein [Aestuariicella hydrocarbonica]NHO65052.1 YbaK/EbsC family protein [Aestuariicella hydrocarbonica]
MGVAITLENFLKTKDINYDLREHRYVEGSFNTALSADIPSEQLIKGVVFRDEDLYYTMAIVPASHRVLRHTLNQILDRRLELADEEELDDIFFDCEHGAIPSFGQAYGINVIWDDQIKEVSDVWLEAGDHENLIHIDRRDFDRLMQNHMHETISCARRRHRS